MNKFLGFIFLLIVSLAGCRAGSEIFLLSETTYTDNGSTFSIRREARSMSHQDVTNPPEATLPSISVHPVMLEGNKVSWQLQSSGAHGKGAFKSIQEAAMFLLAIPMWIGGAICVLGILLIAFTPFKKMGMFVVIGGAGLIALSWFLGAYSNFIAIGGIILALGVGGYFIWRFILEKRARKELVGNIEHIKDNVLSSDQKNKLFKDDNAEIKAKQSKSTRKLVDQERKELGLKTG